MDKLIQHFNKLYPNYSTQNFTGACKICEVENAGANNFSELEITGINGELFPHYLPKDASSFYTKANSPNVLLLDCDGIFFTEYNGRKIIFLCELKSSFATESIVHAKEQLVGSFLKLHALFSLLQAYNKEDLEVRGIIASFLPTEETLSYLKNQENKKNRFCVRLHAERRYLMQREKCINFYSQMCVADFMIHYVGVPCRASTYTVDINAILI